MIFANFVGMKLKGMPTARKNKVIIDIMTMLLSDETPNQNTASNQSQPAEVSLDFTSARAFPGNSSSNFSAQQLQQVQYKPTTHPQVVLRPANISAPKPSVQSRKICQIVISAY
jgi:hypothetical protein